VKLNFKKQKDVNRQKDLTLIKDFGKMWVALHYFILERRFDFSSQLFIELKYDSYFS